MKIDIPKVLVVSGTRQGGKTTTLINIIIEYLEAGLSVGLVASSSMTTMGIVKRLTDLCYDRDISDKLQNLVIFSNAKSFRNSDVDVMIIDELPLMNQDELVRILEYALMIEADLIYSQTIGFDEKKVSEEVANLLQACIMNADPTKKDRRHKTNE